MKKLFLTICLVVGLASSAHAGLDLGDLAQNIPTNQGVVYSLKDSEFNHVTSAILMSKGDFGFEAGYIDNGKLLTALSYKIVDLKKYIEIPVLQELFFRPGLYVGFDEIASGDPKVDYGISFTCLEVKF